MGTRADFYIGTGQQAEWLGSFAWDGHPSSVAEDLSLTKETPHIASEDDWRESVAALLKREDATLPERGWPWPWATSAATDYTYTWTPDSPVLVSCGGSGYRPLLTVLEDGEDDADQTTEIFPDMSARMNVRWDVGSGLIFLRGV